MRRSFIAVLAAGALTLSACGGNTDSGSEESPAAEATTSAAEATEAAPASVEVEDNNGKYTIAVPPKSVVATDNRTFETLADWGVELKAASEKGWIDEKACVLEALLGCVRAGADAIITYYAKDVAQWLQEDTQ